MWKFSRREVSRISRNSPRRNFLVGKFPGFPEILPGETFSSGSFPDFPKFSRGELFALPITYMVMYCYITPFQSNGAVIVHYKKITPHKNF
jgi:hypothetical protein